MSKKREYTVTYPILGYVSMTVDADSPEAANDAFWDSVNNHEGDALKNPDFDTTEFDFVEEVVRGNVCYAQYAKVEIEEVE